MTLRMGDELFRDMTGPCPLFFYISNLMGKMSTLVVRPQLLFNVTAKDLNGSNPLPLT